MLIKCVSISQTPLCLWSSWEDYRHKEFFRRTIDTKSQRTIDLMGQKRTIDLKGRLREVLWTNVGSILGEFVEILKLFEYGGPCIDIMPFVIAYYENNFLYNILVYSSFVYFFDCFGTYSFGSVV